MLETWFSKAHTFFILKVIKRIVKGFQLLATQCRPGQCCLSATALAWEHILRHCPAHTALASATHHTPVIEKFRGVGTEGHAYFYPSFLQCSGQWYPFHLGISKRCYSSNNKPGVRSQWEHQSPHPTVHAEMK